MTGFDDQVGACVAQRMTTFFEREPPGRLELAITFWKRGEPSPDDTSIARGLFRYPRDVVGAYRPGANPLRAHVVELEGCLARRYGAAVVDLSTATVYGIEDATASACVAAIANQIGGKTRCAFAYGEMPLDGLATLEISDTTITIGGEQPVNMYGVMVAVAKRALRSDTEVLAIRSPLVVKPTGATLAVLVIDVIGYVVRAGDDVVIATQRGAEWKPLGKFVLPSPPVPLGTGGHWAPYKPRGNAKPTRETLSLLVGPRDLWLVNSTTKEVVKMPHRRAEHLLRDARKRFTRDDLEIGVLPTVTWASLVEIIDSAETVGFAHWQLVEHDALGEAPEE